MCIRDSLRSLQGCFTINGDRSSLSILKKWKQMELPLLYIFCCSGHFSMWIYVVVFLGKSLMYHMHRELKDAMYLILLYCLFAYTWKFKNTCTNVTPFGRTLDSGSNLADIGHVSLHFVPQVAFSSLNLHLIFLQWSRGPFVQSCVLFTRNDSPDVS